MASKTVALLLADLGVTKSHSRPHCSNDNPFSEAHFKTLKYRPEFPGRFGSIEDGRAFCQRFFRWYNHEHRHSGIGFHTPADVHFGRAGQAQLERVRVLREAYAAHPERFVRQAPVPPSSARTSLDQQTCGGSDRTLIASRPVSPGLTASGRALVMGLFGRSNKVQALAPGSIYPPAPGRDILRLYPAELLEDKDVRVRRSMGMASHGFGMSTSKTVPTSRATFW